MSPSKIDATGAEPMSGIFPRRGRLHSYTLRAVEESYRFDDAAYDGLAAAGVSWQEVLHVLRTPPRVRHHIGSVLRVAGLSRSGRWIAVACIEEGDDEYLVVGARALSAEEAADVRKMIEGGT